MTAEPELPRIVIVGGGFAGLYCARALKGVRARLTLVDRRNHHLFQPLLYQVATAALNPGDIAYPIRAVLRRQGNARVLMGEVEDFDLDEQRVELADGSLEYDHLVIAAGSAPFYFGNDRWERHAPGLKSVEDALEIRRRVLSAYEHAERETSEERVREWLTFVVIGAGPTGVELAGALSEIGRQTMARDFRSFDPKHLRVVLVEADDRVLPPYPPDLSEKALGQLRRIGVEVELGVRASEVDERGISLGDRRIASRTVLWAAGVQASPLGRKLGVETDKGGRVLVEQDLTVPGRPQVYVVGDLMHLEQDGEPVPGLAPAAIQAGRHAARNIRRVLAGEERLPFRYRDKGSLATIGRAAAVADLGRVRLNGFTAWVLWWAVHIFFLIGYRNRVFVLIGWAWQYLTFQRGARLITARGWEPGDRT